MPWRGCNALRPHVVKPALQPPTRPFSHYSLVGNAPFTNLTPLSVLDFGKPPEPKPNAPAKRIAILGGGITGLATAWHITRQLPHAHITIFEKSHRLGGWVDSGEVAVGQGPHHGHVVFERGPRTLRPALHGAGLATGVMLHQLDLVDDIIGISRTSPASTNRFLYYPDHLVRLPGRLGSVSDLYQLWQTMFQEPAFDGVLRAVLTERARDVREERVKDESVGSFLRRRFGKNVTDNLASAVFHGIYAGDIEALSARTTLSQLYYLETRHADLEPGIMGEHAALLFYGLRSLSYNYARYRILADVDCRQFLNAAKFLRTASAYTLRQGLSQITQTLEDRLRRMPNITVSTGAHIQAVDFDPVSSQVLIGRDGESVSFDHVASSLGASELKTFLSSKNARHGKPLNADVARALERTKGVNIGVVNLFFPDANLIPESVRGFGYLIPRSIPLDQNPERALGVIFGSESSGRPGTVVSSGVKPVDCQDTVPGTKLTVMLGGHWWDGWEPHDLPDEYSIQRMSLDVLHRHLGISASPVVQESRLNVNCIPQYPVGYREDMATVHTALLAEYHGRFKVAGPWWQGAVGFNDSVLKAWEISTAICNEWDDETGLKEYASDEKFCLQDRRFADAPIYLDSKT